MGRHEAPRAGSPSSGHGGAHESAAAPRARRPLPRIVGLTAAFAVLAAVVVALALLWTGAEVGTALIVGGGLLVVFAVAGLLLRATGLLDSLPDDDADGY